MRVHLTFDIEIWCGGWDHLDERFASAFERYVWGHSKYGDYALPETLNILRKNNLVGVFFVEPLFSLRFGIYYLKVITSLISDAGQDIQLHLHPEWVDEIKPALLRNVIRKRQHLTYFTVEEQTALLHRGRQVLEDTTARPVTAFRSGSYAVNRDSYRAMATNGLLIDSSLNTLADFSTGSLGRAQDWNTPLIIEGVDAFPVTVFSDGFGRLRHLEIGACSFAEMREVLDSAFEQGAEDIVFVSHNFEMLRRDSTIPDHVVVKRFERLCTHLAANRDRFEVTPLRARNLDEIRPGAHPALVTSPVATAWRYFEQTRRRLT